MVSIDKFVCSFFQIDGSTLRTLCIQHGPLVTFHLYLNQGIALCKYATREEANKAQMALNKCVLGNTTIFAELPCENEVLSILQHLPQTSSSANSTTGTNVSGNSMGTAANVSSSGTCSSNGNGSGIMAGSGTATNTTSVSGNSVGGSVNSIISGSSTNSAANTNSANANVSVNGSVAGGNNVSKSVSGSNSLAISAGQPNVSNVSSTTGNSSTWRQTTQNQTLQGQNRPSGREADYDYISQYVCSIVDD